MPPCENSPLPLAFPNQLGELSTMTAYEADAYFEDGALHGTSVTRMNQILASRTFFTRPGRRGQGVYFWKMNAFAERVAYKWHAFALGRGDFKGDAEPHCGIIDARLRALEDAFLDLNDSEIQNLIVEMADKARLTKDSSDEDISAFYDLLVDKLEQQAETSFWVLSCPLTLPGHNSFYPFNAIGNPVSYIVRDQRSIISMNGRVLAEDPT